MNGPIKGGETYIINLFTYLVPRTYLNSTIIEPLRSCVDVLKEFELAVNVVNN